MFLFGGFSFRHFSRGYHPWLLYCNPGLCFAEATRKRGGVFLQRRTAVRLYYAFPLRLINYSITRLLTSLVPCPLSLLPPHFLQPLLLHYPRFTCHPSGRQGFRVSYTLKMIHQVLIQNDGVSDRNIYSNFYML